MQDYQSKKEIMKINLDIENIGGLGVKGTKNEGILGATFAWKPLCHKFNQINGKGHGTNRNFEN